MLSLVALGVFSFITSSFAVCPENHAIRAKECVAVFTRFGKASHQGPGAISQICSEVYGALDCLREIMNNCEEYKNMGLQLSPEDYEKTKSRLDAACAGDKPANDVVSDISKRVNTMDLTQSKTLIARATEKDLTQSNTLSAKATEKECQTMSESCLTIVDSLGDAGGQREVTCNGMRSMLTCLQNIFNECADHLDDYNIDTMMAGYQQHLGVHCNGNENEIGGPGAMPGGPRPMPGGSKPMPGEPGPMSGEPGLMPGGPGPMPWIPGPTPGRTELMRGGPGVLKQCEDKFNECGYLGAQLEAAGAQGQVTRCVLILRQHAECNDQLLAVCESLMPDKIKQLLEATAQQYKQICQGSNKAEVSKKKPSRPGAMPGESGPMPWRPGPMPGRTELLRGGPGVLKQCEDKFNECGYLGAQLEAAGAQGKVTRCVLILRQHAECNDQLLAVCESLMPDKIKQRLEATAQQYKQICGPGAMSGGPGAMPGEPGPRPWRPGPTPGRTELMRGGPGVLKQCEDKFNECGYLGVQLEAAGAQGQVTRCVLILRQHAECNDQLLGGCDSLMPEYIKQSLAAAGQQYKTICQGSNKGE